MEIEKETFLPPKILFGLDENNSELKYTLQETKNINFNELNNKNKLPYILVLIDEMRYLNTKSIEMLENILEKGNAMGVYVVASSQLCNCKKTHNYFSTIFAGYRSKDHYIEMLLECPNLKKLELGEMYFKSPTIFSELKKIKIPYVCHNKNLLNIIRLI